MAAGSGVASYMGRVTGLGGGAFGAAHDIAAARYNQKRGIDSAGNRGNIGHNTVAAGLWGF